ncbi:MAG: cytidine deaminase [Bacteroidetes bacterium]|nr:cytidine deaminase [Bacteroidota bacterium]
MINQISFQYEAWPDDSTLSVADRALLQEARQVTALAYAPYSNFWVGAAARLVSGNIVLGTNQENASYPVGSCAERVLLGHAAVRFPEDPIETLAISYHPKDKSSAVPLYPCGMCRQVLLEHEMRFQRPIRLILSGMSGPVHVVDSAESLLPFAFTGKGLRN